MKKILLNTIILFALGFLIHFGGDVFGKFPILNYFFPKSESIFEHSKLYTTGVLLLIVIYYLIGKKLSKTEILKLLISLVLMLALNNSIFELINILIEGHNMTLTLILYFIILLISQIVVDKLINNNLEDEKVNFYNAFLTCLIAIFIILFTHI